MSSSSLPQSANVELIDCSRGYQATFEAVRAAVLSNKKRYLCGGNADKFETLVALQNYLPCAELEIVGSAWRWDREQQIGQTVKEVIDVDNSCLLFIPHVNNEALLQQAVLSIAQPKLNIWVVDSSKYGLDLSLDWLAPCSVLRLPYETAFTRMQNAMIKKARAANAQYLLFMHSDARAHDKEVLPDLLSFMGGKTGVAFTNYDALCCFDMRCVRDVGFWDESYSWYSSDCDYYHRIRQQGWAVTETPLRARVDHIVSATLKTGVDLRNVLDPSGWHTRHHAHKWAAGGCGQEQYRTPYGIEPVSSFAPDDVISIAAFDVHASVQTKFQIQSALSPNTEGNISCGSSGLYCDVLLALREREPTLAKKPRILEIGFNAGHSSVVFAACFPDAEIVSVDIGEHSYVRVAFESVQFQTSNKRQLLIGDSRARVPELTGKFDLIFIDGCHQDGVPAADLANCARLAHENTIVMMDDVCAYYSGGEPAKVWAAAVVDKKILELGHAEMSNGALGFSYGKYSLPAWSSDA